MCFFDRDRPGILSTGLFLFFLGRSSFAKSSWPACLCRLLVFLSIFCLIIQYLPDVCLAAASGVAKAKPAGQGKVTASPGKKSKDSLQTTGAKISLPPKHIPPKSSVQKGNVKTDSAKKQAKTEPIHGHAWKFGTAKQSRKAAAERWQRGLNSTSLRKRAVSHRKEPIPEVTEEDMLVNPMFPKGKKKSAFSLGFEHKGSSWNNGPSADLHNPGEDYLMEGRNVIRGTTSVDAGNDLNIDLGPELILKDQKARESLSNSNQPDSSLGIGMQFKFGF